MAGNGTALSFSSADMQLAAQAFRDCAEFARSSMVTLNSELQEMVAAESGRSIAALSMANQRIQEDGQVIIRSLMEMAAQLDNTRQATLASDDDQAARINAVVGASGASSGGGYARI